VVSILIVFVFSQSEKIAKNPITERNAKNSMSKNVTGPI